MNIADEIFEYAIASRSTRECLTTEEQQLRELEALKQIIVLVENLGTEDELFFLLKKMVSLHTDLIIKVENIIESETSAEKQSKRVFIIRDEKGALQLVIKLFYVDAQMGGDCVRELSVAHLFHHHDFKNFKTVDLLGVYKGRVDDIGLLFIVEKVAPGEELQDVFARAPQDSKEGKGDFESYKKIAKGLGEALGELHNKGGGLKGTLRKYAKEQLGIRFLISQKEWTSEIEGVEALNLAAAFYQIMEAVEDVVFPYSLHHGDLGFDNVIYDASKGALTFVNASRAHLSIDVEGEGIGIPACDLTQVEENFRMLTIFAWSQESISNLVSVFREGYLSHKIELVDKALYDLFVFSHCFWLLGYYGDRAYLKDSETRKEAKAKYNFAIERVRSFL